MNWKKHSTLNIQHPTSKCADRLPLGIESWVLNVERFFGSMARCWKSSFRAIRLLPVLLLAGCGADDHAPTVDVLGSYFPAWIVCIVLGLVLTLITRQVLIGFKLHAHLRPVALVYLCLMIFYTLAIWLIVFKN